jgi:hypothetical protein
MTIGTSFWGKITRAQENRTEEIRIFNPQDFPAGIGVTRVIIPLIGRIAKRIGLCCHPPQFVVDRRRVCEGNRLPSKFPITGSASITKTFELRKNGSRNTPSHCQPLRFFWELVCSVSGKLSNRVEQPNKPSSLIP